MLFVCCPFEPATDLTFLVSRPSSCQVGTHRYRRRSGCKEQKDGHFTIQDWLTVRLKSNEVVGVRLKSNEVVGVRLKSNEVVGV